MDGSDRRRVRAVAIVRALVAAGFLAVAACGGGGGAPPSTLKPQPSSTADARVPTILKAYTDALAAEDRAAELPDPNYPGLEATLIDPALSRARHFVLDEQQQGIVGRGAGEVQLHPHVSEISGHAATVLDCLYDTSLLVYAATGQPVPDQPGGTEPHWVGGRHTLRQVGSSVWRLSETVLSEGSCPAGY